MSRQLSVVSCQLHPAFCTAIRDRSLKRFLVAPMRCQWCGECFDAAKAKTAFRILPNTFNLPDRSHVLLECYHCGFYN